MLAASGAARSAAGAAFAGAHRIADEAALRRALQYHRRGKRPVDLLEGRRLVQDAMAAGARLRAVFCTQSTSGKLPGQIKGLPCYEVDDGMMEKLSDLVTPPGLVALADRPSPARLLQRCADATDVIPLTVVFDRLKDPANVAWALRGLAAVGVRQIVTTAGSCDFWSPKALRAAAGAHYRVPIFDRFSWRRIAAQFSADATVFIADTPAAARSRNQTSDRPLPISRYDEINFAGAVNVCLIVGGETGYSEDARQLCFDRWQLTQTGGTVVIPMSYGIESLNAAMTATVVAFEMRRQLNVGSDLQCDDD